MIFTDRLLQLQNSIAAIYDVIPIDGAKSFEEYTENDVLKKVIFESFVSSPTRLTGDAAQTDLDRGVHCTEMLTMIRERFPLNARLMWRSRPVFCTENDWPQSGLEPRLFFLRLRIGECK